MTYTATIYRIYQVTLPDSDNPTTTLRAFLEQARKDDSVFDCLVQDDVTGAINSAEDEQVAEAGSWLLRNMKCRTITHHDADIKLIDGIEAYYGEQK